MKISLSLPFSLTLVPCFRANRLTEDVPLRGVAFPFCLQWGKDLEDFFSKKKPVYISSCSSDGSIVTLFLLSSLGVLLSNFFYTLQGCIIRF